MRADTENVYVIHKNKSFALFLTAQFTFWKKEQT